MATDRSIDTNPAPLDGVRVLDLTESVSGAYCTRLLAVYGAEVIMTERAPLGSALRRRGPFISELPEGDNSVLFNSLSAGKQSLLVDYESVTDRKLVSEIAERSDVLVSDLSIDSLETLGLTLAELRRRNPALVITTMPAVDSQSPFAGLALSELTLYAFSGLMSLVGAAGKPPIKAGGYQANFMAGAHAAALTTFAVSGALETGEGAILEAPALSTCAKFFSHMSDPNAVRANLAPAGERRDRSNSIASCEDGFVAVTVYYYQLKILAEMIRRPDVAEDPRFNTASGLQKHSAELQAEIGKWLAPRNKKEIVEAAQRRHLLITPVNTSEDLLQSEHLRSRNFFQDVELVGGKRVAASGPPFRLTSSSMGATRTVPRLGDANTRLGERPSAKVTKREAKSGDRAAARLPLAGIKVLDLTHRLAGPTLTMLLADWGADVIKIEWWHRMDAWRGMISVKDDTDGNQTYNKKHSWLRLNRNKRSLTLNLKSEQGKQVFRDLAVQADVVADNFSAGVLNRLGLGYEQLSQLNPGIIAISMPGFGTTGPDSSYVSNGPTFEAYSGLASITGYSGGEPRNSVGIWPDVVSGVHGAAAIGIALVNRLRTKRGGNIELAQSEALINMIGDAIVERSASGKVRVPSGNSDPTMGPHGVYPCRGEDRWIAIAVASDAHWSALCEVSQGGIPLDDGRFATQSLRHQHADELDELVESWTSSQDCWELAIKLQNNGIDAAPVTNHDDFREREGLPASDFQVRFDNEYLDTYPGPAASLNGAAPPIRLGPPKLGEHTTEILREDLGFSPEKVEDLRRNNAI